VVDGGAAGDRPRHPEIDGPARLAPPQHAVAAVGFNETAYLRATATHARTFATGITNLTPERPARLLDVVEANEPSRADMQTSR
jgi:hypothetical protein